MKNLTVARRYARALFELSSESGALDDVMQGLSNIHTALRTAPDLHGVLLNPMIGVEDKQKVLGAVTSNKLILKF
ncbi:MAG: F0F1 ATP synthase subunit delta, partial [Elusimicrobia bacterium]|nr:F0F1 ATP synthase subunit delta [Elusimicrobiota bacterium]